MPEKEQAQARAILTELARAWRRPLQPCTLDGLVTYCFLLLAWGARINLTGADTLEALVEDHLPDAFAAAKAARIGGRVVDVGSGGGLPAVPFALLRPDCSLLMVEPTAKKVAFLRTAIRELALAGASVHAGRLGDDPDSSEFSEEGNPAFDLAMSRATFPVDDWLTRGRRLVRPGGRVLAFCASSLPRTPPDLEATDLISYTTGQGAPRSLRVYTRRDVSRGTFRS